MSRLHDGRVLIRWMFNAIGLLLILAPQFVVYSAFLMAAAYFYLIPTALLCWITAAGLKRDKPWSHCVGICTSGVLLLGFPWLTIAGAIGLYVLIGKSWRPNPAAAPAPAKPTTDFWDSKRKLKAQSVVLILCSIASSALYWRIDRYAEHAGMPGWHPGWTLWPWVFTFIVFNVALHECGHALIAWAVGFKVRAICVGPFTLRREHSHFHFRFDRARLFENGRWGYIATVPVSDRNLRLNEIAVAAAGPAANALACLVFLEVFFSLPGTTWQNWWWIAAYNGVIAGVLAVCNLIPLGYCDGTMLLHLILWTPAGRLLLEYKRINRMGEEADACHGQADFDKEIELKEAMLQRTLECRPDNALAIATRHQFLGTAYAFVGDWPTAEIHYRKCLGFEAGIATSPALAANAWSGLQLTSIRRHHVAAVGPAYVSAVEALEKRKASGGGPAGPAFALAMLVQVHLRNGDFKTALREIDQGIEAVPGNSGSVPLRAYLLRCKALCRLQLDEIDAGLATAQAAAALYRSPEFPPARRNLAWENLADLGYELWCAGQSEMAIDLLREGIAHLESGGAVRAADTASSLPPFSANSAGRMKPVRNCSRNRCSRPPCAGLSSPSAPNSTWPLATPASPSPIAANWWLSGAPTPTLPLPKSLPPKRSSPGRAWPRATCSMPRPSPARRSRCLARGSTRMPQAALSPSPSPANAVPIALTKPSA
jgi:Zn-dependent protease